ncbi:MAG: preprotein translocase subunit SecA [Saprospiraceae bacterium]|nr:preprotein translocase subunit SecA [Saprospiraceae bacterium]
MIGLIKKVFGDKHAKDIKKLEPRVVQINEIYNSYAALTVDELRGKTSEFRQRITAHLADINERIENLKQKAETDDSLELYEKDDIYNEVDSLIEEKDKQLEVILDEILEEAFAVVKETARRFKENDAISATATELDKQIASDREHISIDGDKVTYQTSWLAAGNRIDWDMVHYDVQLIGGMVLHSGKIAEMATGEGKTLVATLPAYLNGVAGEGVHVITVNDYLARRDSEWMGPIMEFLGLTVDCIDKHSPNTDSRRQAYNADITYGTNNEFGFDYLRDNMVRNASEQVQRKHHYSMIDEVDSVLIDDARTPLIISGPVPKGDQQQYETLKPRIESLVNAQKKLVGSFLVDAKKEIEAGNADQQSGGLALLRAHRGFPKSKPLIKYLSEQGSKSILQKVENFYLQDQAKNMHIVDDELYFVIDEKQNSIELTDKGIDFLTRKDEDPDFFVMPVLGEKMEELDKQTELSDEERISEKDKILAEYSLKGERLHSVQQLLKAYALFEKDVEYVVMEGEVKIVDEQTGRIMDGRRYSDGLHQAIEAKESVKIEAATQTFATITLQNFFRMYHKLAGMTGTAETEAKELWDIYKLDVVTIPTNRPIIRDDRNDKIYKTAREKYNAVIEEIELMREQGRPVLVGTSSVESSELVAKLLRMKGIPHNVLNAKQHQREAEIVGEAGMAGNVTIATNMAGRGTDIKLGQGVKDAGGLAIIATERHDSRRVDRQLRGRAGRQGDPGSSQFFLSLEDNLMRLFASGKVASLMDRMGFQEGEVLQHSLITRSVENAQKKVEENNFGIRKRLLEYDDVMNNQRTVIYKRRKHALFGERLSFDLENMLYDLVEELVNNHHGASEFSDFREDALRVLSTDIPFDEQTWRSETAQQLTSQLFQEFMNAYERKKENILKTAYPVLQNIHKQRGDTVNNVAIPFSDGKKVINTLVNLQEVMDQAGKPIVEEFEKTAVLAFIDNNWKEHLRSMDELRQSVQMATYEQKDPLLIYKFEAFELFQNILNEINREVSSFLMHADLPKQNVQEAKEQKTDLRGVQTNRQAEAAQTNEYKGARTGNERNERRQPVVAGPKVGRNDPCPCGSGKKFKKCHGA